MISTRHEVTETANSQKRKNLCTLLYGYNYRIQIYLALSMA